MQAERATRLKLLLSAWWVSLVRYGIALALVVASVLASACATTAETSRHDGDAQTVARVIDGDTIQLASGERVRLIGVDTPETKHPTKPVQWFGREATEFTTQLVQGKPVRLEYDQQARDRYCRSLAYVFLGDGTLVNAEIIRQGYGFAYTKYPFKRMDEFRQLEREAREQRRGLWGNNDLVH